MKFWKFSKKRLLKLATSGSVHAPEARRELERRQAASEVVANHVRNGLLFKQ